MNKIMCSFLLSFGDLSMTPRKKTKTLHYLAQLEKIVQERKKTTIWDYFDNVGVHMQNAMQREKNERRIKPNII